MTEKNEFNIPSIEDEIEGHEDFNTQYSKFNKEFWEKNDPEFYKLMKETQKGAFNKKTTKTD